MSRVNIDYVKYSREIICRDYFRTNIGNRNILVDQRLFYEFNRTLRNLVQKKLC